MRKIKFGVQISLLAVILACGGCGEKPAAPAAAPAMPIPAVSVEAVQTRDVPVYLDCIGKCAAPEIVSIQPQVSGKIEAVHFKEGSDIKKGDKLFSLDPRPFQAQLDQVKADLALNKAALQQSEATLNQYRAQLEESKATLAQSRTRQRLNQLEFDRDKSLLGTAAITQQDYDTKEITLAAGADQINANTAGVANMAAQIQQGIATVNMAGAKIASSEAAIKAAEINLGYTTIVSPIDGRAGQRLADAGNIVNSNMMGSTSMLMIQRVDPICADFTIPENYLSRVRASMAEGHLSAECAVPDAVGPPRPGKVYFIDSSVQNGTGTVKLRAELPNTDRFFWPGQFVNVRLILDTHKDAALVPQNSAQIGQAGTFVFIVKTDSIVELRPVVLGQQHGAQVVVESGVKAGENVVVSGPLMLFPGAKVSILPPKAVAEKAPDAAKPPQTGGAQ